MTKGGSWAGEERRGVREWGVDECGGAEGEGENRWSVQEGWREGVRVAVEAGGNQRAVMGGQALRMCVSVMCKCVCM